MMPNGVDPVTATPTAPPRRVGATLIWVAIAAGVLGGLALVWPEAARPLVSVLAGIILAAVAIEALMAIISRVPQPVLPSAFHRRDTRTTPELPGELTSILRSMEGAATRRRVPQPAIWALRRVAVERLALRHGRRVSEQDAEWVRPIVSSALFHVLITDSTQQHRLRGEDFAVLLDEVEAL